MGLALVACASRKLRPACASSKLGAHFKINNIQRDRVDRVTGDMDEIRPSRSFGEGQAIPQGGVNRYG